MSLTRQQVLIVCVLLQLFCGCSTSREGKDLRETGVLYPVEKAGSIVSGVGSGLRSLAHSNPWRFQAKRKPKEEINPEDVKWLESFAVELPRSSIEIPETIGLGYGERPVASHAFPIINEVEDLTGRAFRWYVTPDPRFDIAKALRSSVIVLNPEKLAKADTHLQLFILLHEAGHHELGHLSGVSVGAESRKQLELDADAFAAKKLLERGFKGHEIVWIALTSFRENSASDANHPSGEERLKNIRTVVLKDFSNEKPR